MHIQELISPRRVSLSLPATSKKRLLERLSTLLCEGAPDVDVQAAFQSLIERERLGSTGIGEGVALPHGRLKGLTQAVGAFATLAQEMDYDALDRKPVRMAFALLVPEKATDEHLQILAQLARLFSDKRVRERLLEAKTPDEVYNRLTGLDHNA